MEERRKDKSRESCACYETSVTEINIHIPIQDCRLVTVTLYRTRRVQLGPGVAVTKERWLSLTCSAHYRQFHYNTLSETGTWHKRLSRLVHCWRVRDRITISRCQAACTVGAIHNDKLRQKEERGIGLWLTNCEHSILQMTRMKQIL